MSESDDTVEAASRPMSRDEFLAEIEDMVRDQAPVMFALCEEIGDAEDGFVRYWGMSFADHAEIVSALGDLKATFRSAESAQHRLGRKRNLHLLWVRSSV